MPTHGPLSGCDSVTTCMYTLDYTGYDVNVGYEYYV